MKGREGLGCYPTRRYPAYTEYQRRQEEQISDAHFQVMRNCFFNTARFMENCFCVGFITGDFLSAGGCVNRFPGFLLTLLIPAMRVRESLGNRHGGGASGPTPKQ